MKILILQLARLGDIYLTWPTLRALHRSNPAAELHICVREKFVSALQGLDVPLHVHVLKTRDVLAPLILNEKENESLECLSTYVERLSEQDFDEIINLSFSPFSSYLVDLIKHEKTKVRGYCRHSDGFLNIPDDASAYFYAQVGIGSWNRYHLGEILAAVAGPDLEEEDWRGPSPVRPFHSIPLPKDFFVVQVSSSQEEKSYPAFKWRQTLQKLIERKGLHFVLVGAVQDQDLVAKVTAGLPRENFTDLVGLTEMSDIFDLIERSHGVLGSDSVCMQMATLMQKPCFNLSFAVVNYWETGPRAMGSRIFWGQRHEEMDSESVASEFIHWVDGEPSQGPLIERVSSEVIGYRGSLQAPQQFAWNLIEAIYTGQPFPQHDTTEQRLAFHRLYEVSELAREQIGYLKQDPKSRTPRLILDNVDEILLQVGRLCPEVNPLIRWFNTERIRIGPAAVEEVIEKTEALFAKLSEVCAIYQVVEGLHDRFNMVE